MSENFKAPKEVVELREKAAESLEIAQKIVIVDDAGFNHANEVLKNYKRQTKELTDKRLSLTRPLDESKKGIMDFFREPLDYLAKAEKAIKAGMIVYSDKIEAERKAKQEQLEREAEKERIYQENLAKKRLATAEKNGNQDRVEEIKDEIETIQTQTVAPVIDMSGPKANGTHFTETWSCELVDLMSLIKAVAAGQAPISLVEANMKTANQMARAMKQDFNFAGLKAVSKKNIASRI